ncbi:MAG TPA: hypothetical protein VIJ57_10120 [Hanamia sp.]
MLTVNQLLDQILTKYKSGDLEKFPDVHSLKCNLIELKVFYGGNTPIENEEEAKEIIETGQAPK